MLSQLNCSEPHLLTIFRLQKSDNRNGAFSNSSIGVAMGKRICRIFTSNDPNSTDV